jgi:PAS domain S-box-containing protein
MTDTRATSAVLAKRRQADEALRENEEHFHSVAQTASDAIISADSQGQVVFWNQAAEAMFGYSADEVVGEPLALIMPKRLHEAHQKGWRRFASTGETRGIGTMIEGVGLRKDGSEFPIELSLTTWKTDGEVFFTAIIRDITGRKQMEAKREAAYQLLQSTIDGVNEPIMVIGTDYQVKLMNQAVRDDYPVGTGGEPVYCYQVSHNRDAPCTGAGHPCPLEQVRESLRPVTVVHEHIRRDGEGRLVEIVVSPLLGKDGTLTGIVEAARDITERVRAEEALRESERRYRTLSAENRKLAESLRRQSAQRGMLLKGLITAQEDERKRVARELHDELGQALGGLALQVGTVEHLIASDADRAIGQLDGIRALISETTDRMYGLILDLRPSALDDLGLAAALGACADRMLADTGITFTLGADELTDRLPPEVETTLYRIFQEALSNVVRHAGAKRVCITLARRDGAFEGEIADDGRGFDPEAVPLDERSPRGLGLLGMRERVAQCGGELEIISQPGSGARLRICIPLAEGASPRG